MSIERIELGEICEFLDSKRMPVTESDRKPGPYPYYGANGLQGWIDGFIFDEPLILLAEDGGAFGSKTKPIAYKVTGKSWVNNHAHVLRPYSNCDLNYLCHILSLYDVTKYVNGTTRQKLTKSEAEQIPIPFPPLPEQRRIAAQLDKADRLRRTRRYAAQLSDTFLQAVFVRIFGDPITNSLNFPLEKLEDLIDPERPITYGIVLPGDHIEGGVPYVRVVDMKDGQISLAGLRRTTTSIAESYKRSSLKPGDLLLSIRGQVGRLAIVPANLDGANITQDTARLATTEKIDVYYLLGCLDSAEVQEYMGNLIKGAAIQGINLGDVKEFMIPLPPLALQQKFARIVQQFERLRAQQREAERQAEHLFQTLLHRAFT